MKAKAGKRASWQPLGKIKAKKTEKPKGGLVFGPKDKALLEELEAVIAGNIGAFLRLGEALSVIKERNLQQIWHPELSFDEYCSKKWGFGKAYAYRLISSWECVRNLTDAMAPQGAKHFPTNEAQVRPLTRLSPEEQVKAWAKVLQKAKGGFITAALVENVVYGKAVKPSKSYRVSKTPEAAAKAEHKKLQAIGSPVEKALKVDPSERSINQLSKILMKIQDLLKR
jgi:hypothetical protein